MLSVWRVASLCSAAMLFALFVAYIQVDMGAASSFWRATFENIIDLGVVVLILVLAVIGLAGRN